MKLGLGSLVFSVFLILKLAGVEPVEDWSWWWVTSPLWISALLSFLLLVLGAVVMHVGRGR